MGAIKTLKTGQVDRLVFGPDNRTFLTTGKGWLRVWDLATGRERGSRALRTSPTDTSRNIESWVVVTADGRRAVTNMDDGTAVIWDLTTFPVARLDANTNPSLETWWEELQSKDMTVAYTAFWKLAQAPLEDTVTFLNRRLKPAPTPDPNTVKQLIAELGSDDFQTRESAVEKTHGLWPFRQRTGHASCDHGGFTRSSETQRT